MRALLAVILTLAVAAGFAASETARDVDAEAPGEAPRATPTMSSRRTPRRHSGSGATAFGAGSAGEEESADSATSHRSGCLVSGRVVDADGARVDRAEVLVFDAFGKEVEKAVSDDSTFEVEIARTGAVRCVARASGRVAVASAWVMAAPGGSIDAGTLVLVPGERIAGRVCDPLGRGIRGAFVNCSAADDAAIEAWESAVRQDWSRSDGCDEDGNFLLTGLAPGRYLLRISPPGACTWWSEGSIVEAGGETVLLTMPAEYVPRCCCFEVRAEDEDGNAISDFSASLVAWGNRDARQTIEGEVSVGLIESPPFRLAVGSEGFEATTIENVEDLPYTIVVRLSKPRAAAERLDISGVVEFEGAPLPVGASADLELRASGDAGSRGDPLDRVETGEGGKFEFRPKAAGTWRIAAQGSISRDGDKILVMGSTDASTGDRGVRILLLPRSSISGEVCLPDDAVADELWVNVLERRPGGVVRTESIETNRSEFAIGGLPSDGVFLVGVSVRVGEAWMRGTVVDGVVAGAATIEFRPEPGLAIEGVVVRADGSPVAGARVFTLADRPHYRIEATGVDGRFRLTGLREGVERLSATAPGLVLAGAAESASAGATGVRIVVVPQGR